MLSLLSPSTDTVVRYLEASVNATPAPPRLGRGGGGATAALRIWATSCPIRYSLKFVVPTTHPEHAVRLRLDVAGSDFEVARNLIEISGTGSKSRRGAPVARLHHAPNCWGGEVHDNHVHRCHRRRHRDGRGSCSIVHTSPPNIGRHVFGGTPCTTLPAGRSITPRGVAHISFTAKTALRASFLALQSILAQLGRLNGHASATHRRHRACNQFQALNVPTSRFDVVKGLTTPTIQSAIPAAALCKGRSSLHLVAWRTCSIDRCRPATPTRVRTAAFRKPSLLEVEPHDSAVFGAPHEAEHPPALGAGWATWRLRHR